VEPDLSGVPEELTDLLAGMVAHDPARRPTVQEVQQRLLAVVDGAGSISEMRRRLVATTYVAPAPATPGGAAADSPAGRPDDDDDVPGPVRGIAIDDVAIDAVATDPAPDAAVPGGSSSLGIPAQGRGSDTTGDSAPPRPAASAEPFDPEATVLVGPPPIPPPG